MKRRKTDAGARRYGPECWKCWRRSLWAPRRAGNLDLGVPPALLVFEWLVQRSLGETRCVECGALGTVRCRSVIVPRYPHYWMCAGCAAWERERQQREQGAEVTA